MTKSSRIQPIIKIAKNKEQDAAKQMRETQKSLLEQQDRMNELQLYQQEYQRLLEERGKTGMGIDKLQEYREFIRRIGHAIQQQHHVVATYQQQHDEKHQQWLNKRVKHKALDKFIERAKQQKLSQEASREQAESDDRGQKRIK